MHTNSRWHLICISITFYLHLLASDTLSEHSFSFCTSRSYGHIYFTCYTGWKMLVRYITKCWWDTSQNIKVHFVGCLYIFRLYILLGLYYVVLHEDLHTDWYSLTRWSKHLHKETEKTKPVQRSRHHGQLNVDIEDKNCASYNWSIRNN